MLLLQLYGLASLMVLVLALGPFLRDPSNPKASWQAWAFLALAIVLSPITLPSMLVRWGDRHQNLPKTTPTKSVGEQLG